MQPATTVVTLISNPELSALVVRALAKLPGRVLTQSPEAAFQDGWFSERGSRQFQCDVMFLEVAPAGQRSLDLIQTIESRTAAPAVVTVHVGADTDGLLAAFRAGADDCLCEPVDEATVRQVLQRVIEKRAGRQPPRSPAKTVGFLSPAGGCGATTVACHFAHELCRASSQSTLLAVGYPRRRVRLLLSGVRKRRLHTDEVSKALGWEVEAPLPFDAAEIEQAQAEGRLIFRKSNLGKRIAQLTAKFVSEPLDEMESLQAKPALPVTALDPVLDRSWRLSN